MGSTPIACIDPVRDSVHVGTQSHVSKVGQPSNGDGRDARSEVRMDDRTALEQRRAD